MTHSLRTRFNLFIQPAGFTFLLLLLPVAASPAASKTEQFQAILDAAVDAGVMAVSAHVYWDGGFWVGTAGETSADSGEPLGPDSLFRIASITKLFTATVILQLVDENILQLSDTLADRLQEGPVLSIPHADSISVEMLLNHTTGIRNFSAVDDFWTEAYGDRGLDRIWEPDELISYALREKPYFTPGAAGQRESTLTVITSCSA